MITVAWSPGFFATLYETEKRATVTPIAEHKSAVV